MSNKMTPNVRFKEFTDAWEQRKLGDISDSYSGGTPSISRREYYGGTIPFIRSAEIGQDHTELYLTEEGLNNSSAKNVEVGDLLYALYGATSGEVGISQIKGAINQAILVIKPKKNYNTQFIGQWLGFQKTHIISKYLQGGQGNLSGSIVKRLEIKFPSFDEQNKISLLTELIDNSIAHHQKKLESLQQLKKLFLQKIFDQEWRFKGFADPWEQRKYADMASKFDYGLNASAIEYDGIHKYLRITDIDDESHKFIQTNLTSPDIDFSKSNGYKLSEGDILFARTGASTGKTYMYQKADGLTYFAGFLIRAHTNDSADACFFFQSTLTRQYKQFIKINSQRSGQPGVNSKEYAKYKLLVPSKSEQQKIGNFLADVDDTIAHHQKKLDQLKQLKKWFLQNLFV